MLCQVSSTKLLEMRKVKILRLVWLVMRWTPRRTLNRLQLLSPRQLLNLRPLQHRAQRHGPRLEMNRSYHSLQRRDQPQHHDRKRLRALNPRHVRQTRFSHRCPVHECSYLLPVGKKRNFRA